MASSRALEGICTCRGRIWDNSEGPELGRAPSPAGGVGIGVGEWEDLVEGGTSEGLDGEPGVKMTESACGVGLATVSRPTTPP